MKVELPVTLRVPVWEMFPVVAVAAKVPVAVVVPKIKPEASVTATFAPVKLTAPVNWLALSRIMFCPTAEIVVVPATVNVVPTDWVTAVVEVTARLPLIDPIPITSGDSLLFRVAFAPVRLIAPVN